MSHQAIAALFLAYAAASLTWTTDIYAGLDALWRLTLLSGLFCIGARLPSLRPVYIGAGLGIAINSAIAIAQAAGWQGIEQALIWTVPAGLFANKNFLAEAAALVLVGALVHRLWWLVPGLLPAVYLPHTRGALAALAVAGTAWLWSRSRLAAAGVALALLMGALFTRFDAFLNDAVLNSGVQRVAIWLATIENLTLFGHGLGSYPPGHAHNDLLEASYEMGIGIIPLVACLTLAWRRGGGVRLRSDGDVHAGDRGRGHNSAMGAAIAASADRLVVLAFLVEGAFSFPAHLPVTAALAALAWGHLCGDRVVVRSRINGRRGYVRARLDGAGSGYVAPTARARDDDIPAQWPISRGFQSS